MILPSLVARPLLALSLCAALLAGGCAGTRPAAEAPVGTQVASLEAGGLGRSIHARLLDDRLIASDGAELPLRRWLPKGAPQAVVLALHGFNDYSNAFAAPGPELAQQGIAVYAYDQRGFGQAPQPGHWAGQRALVDDAATALRLLRERYPTTPLYLMGESMGGAVSILTMTNTSAASHVDGLILVAPAVWGRQTMNIFQRAGLWVARLMPSMHVSGRSLPVKVHASDNIEMLRAYSADPLVIKETRVDAVNGLVDLMSAALNAAPALDVPALVLYGEHDEIVPRTPVARMVAALPPGAKSRQKVALYPNGWHMLLRDLDGAAVTADVAAWVKRHDGALPSGADRTARADLTGRPEDAAVAAAK